MLVDCEEKMKFAVRNLPVAGLEGAFRIHVNQELLYQEGLQTGDLCEINDDGKHMGYGIAWRSGENMSTNSKQRPAKISHIARETYGLNEGDHVNLGKTDAKIVHANKVTLRDITPNDMNNADKQVEDGRWKMRSMVALGKSTTATISEILLTYRQL